MVTLRTTLKKFTLRLDQAAVDSPRLSAEVLLAAALGIERSDLLKTLVMQPERPLTPEEVARAESLVARRETGEPVAYLVGKKEFYGREFTVTPATLIPRPDTETLIEAALAFAAGCTAASHPHRFLDMGTGSGAIAITLALELPHWQGLAVDIVEEALAVARQNAHNLHAQSVTFLREDFLSPTLPGAPYTIVAANPPYVSEEEYRTLSREVALFEPKSALVPAAPEADGLECLTTILDRSHALLAPGGLLLMEMGAPQGEALVSCANTAHWRDIHIKHDMAGLPRVFSTIKV